jgi:hypothetical protein
LSEQSGIWKRTPSCFGHRQNIVIWESLPQTGINALDTLRLLPRDGRKALQKVVRRSTVFDGFEEGLNRDMRTGKAMRAVHDFSESTETTAARLAL